MSGAEKLALAVMLALAASFAFTGCEVRIRSKTAYAAAPDREADFLLGVCFQKEPALPESTFADRAMSCRAALASLPEAVEMARSALSAADLLESAAPDVDGSLDCTPTTGETLDTERAATLEGHGFARDFSCVVFERGEERGCTEPERAAAAAGWR